MHQRGREQEVADIEQLVSCAKEVARAARQERHTDAWEALKKMEQLLPALERRFVRDALRQGVPLAELARKAGVTRQAISKRLTAWGLVVERRLDVREEPPLRAPDDDSSF